jgi:hypothetical protein
MAEENLIAFFDWRRAALRSSSLSSSHSFSLSLPLTVSQPPFS